LQVSQFGVAGLLVAVKEGVEVNLLGLTTPRRLANIWRIQPEPALHTGSFSAPPSANTNPGDFVDGPVKS